MAAADSTQKNKAFFNQEAATYDSRHGKTLGQILAEIRKRAAFLGLSPVEGGGEGHRESVRLLDYACGTGSISRALSPYVTQTVGIDLSENMVSAYNAGAESQGLTRSQMHAYQGNLCTPSDPNPAAFAGPEFHGFDVAAVGLGFHHFDDPEAAADRLVRRLRVGGRLFIVDFLPHQLPAVGHDAAHTVTHHGFSEERIRALFEAAGAGGDFAFESTPIEFTPREDAEPRQRMVFFATGVKDGENEKL